MVKAILSRLLSSEYEESFKKPFIRWVVSRTYSRPWPMLHLTFTLLFVLWNSAENSPFKANIFKRDKQFLLNNEITYTMLFYLRHSKSWATKWPSSYEFPLITTPTIFLYFDTLLINSSCFAPFALCSGLFVWLWILDKWTSNNSKSDIEVSSSGLWGCGWGRGSLLLYYFS